MRRKNRSAGPGAESRRAGASERGHEWTARGRWVGRPTPDQCVDSGTCGVKIIKLAVRSLIVTGLHMYPLRTTLWGAEPGIDRHDRLALASRGPRLTAASLARPVIHPPTHQTPRRHSFPGRQRTNSDPTPADWGDVCSSLVDPDDQGVDWAVVASTVPATSGSWSSCRRRLGSNRCMLTISCKSTADSGNVRNSWRSLRRMPIAVLSERRQGGNSDGRKHERTPRKHDGGREWQLVREPNHGQGDPPSQRRDGPASGHRVGDAAAVPVGHRRRSPRGLPEPLAAPQRRGASPVGES